MWLNTCWNYHAHFEPSTTQGKVRRFCEPQQEQAAASHSTIYPYGPFPVGDGNTVMLGLQNDREWRGFCELVLKMPGLTEDSRFATNPQRSANRVELNGLVRDEFSQLALEDVTRRLDAAGIANAAVNTMGQVWEHPQLSARDQQQKADSR